MVSGSPGRKNSSLIVPISLSPIIIDPFVKTMCSFENCIKFWKHFTNEHFIHRNSISFQ